MCTAYVLSSVTRWGAHRLAPGQYPAAFQSERQLDSRSPTGCARHGLSHSSLCGCYAQICMNALCLVANSRDRFMDTDCLCILSSAASYLGTWHVHETHVSHALTIAPPSCTLIFCEKCCHKVAGLCLDPGTLSPGFPVHPRCQCSRSITTALLHKWDIET